MSIKREITFAPAAEEQYYNLPDLVQNFLAAELLRLADGNPDSVLASSPFIEESLHDGEPHMIFVIHRLEFKELLILAIGVDPPYESASW